MASTDNLNPEFLARVQAMMAAAPGKVSIGSGWRSNAQQAALYKAKPNLAARPGTSRHERGEAIDFVFEGGQEGAVAKWVHANAARFGLSFPMSVRRPGKKYEPWHGELARGASATKFGVPTKPSAQVAANVTPTEAAAATTGAGVGSDRKDIGVQIGALLSILDKPIDFAAPKQEVA